MGKNDSAKIGFFEKYLTIWVVLCMVIGVLIGMYLPGIPDFLGRFEYANVSIPIAILIWLMIYPMMLKVDFQSIKNVGKNPKGLFVTWVTNWMIKPFTMFGIAWLFFFVIFNPGRIGTRLSRGSNTSWSGTVYCDGICMELFDQRQPSLYRGASGNKRSYNSHSIHAYSCVSSRCGRCNHTMEYPYSICNIVCCYPIGWWYNYP